MFVALSSPFRERERERGERERELQSSPFSFGGIWRIGEREGGLFAAKEAPELREREFGHKSGSLPAKLELHARVREHGRRGTRVCAFCVSSALCVSIVVVVAVADYVLCCCCCVVFARASSKRTQMHHLQAIALTHTALSIYVVHRVCMTLLLPSQSASSSSALTNFFFFSAWKASLSPAAGDNDGDGFQGLAVFAISFCVSPSLLSSQLSLSPERERVHGLQ